MCLPCETASGRRHDHADMTDMTIKDWGRDQENEFQWEKKSDTPLDFVWAAVETKLTGSQRKSVTQKPGSTGPTEAGIWVMSDPKVN